MALNKYNKIHFLGIGGIGVSAIAAMIILEGKKVTGSDISLSEITDRLEKMGAKIKQGQSFEMIPEDTDLIIYTSAIEVADSKLIQKIKESGIPSMGYSEVLGEISKEKKTIAIAGTAGKTTVTAMIAEVLMDSKHAPTVIIGSLMKKTGSNFMAGKSDYLLVEADEYKRQFLNLQPHILVINNIDADHLDYYKDLEDIQSAFHELAMKVPASGRIICDINDEKMKPIISNTNCIVVDRNKIDIKDLNLKLPGEHNRLNAKTALSVALSIGVEESEAKKALSEFMGTWRRFEYKGKTKGGAIIYDDYAHNPQKVASALSGAKEMYSNSNIIAVFQPHLFSRTKTLLKEFAKSFDSAHKIILLPIYPARESFDPTISSKHLFDEIVKSHKKINNQIYLVNDFKQAQEKIGEISDKNSIIMVMGAGDINKLSEMLINK